MNNPNQQLVIEGLEALLVDKRRHLAQLQAQCGESEDWIQAAELVIAGLRSSTSVGQSIPVHPKPSSFSVSEPASSGNCGGSVSSAGPSLPSASSGALVWMDASLYDPGESYAQLAVKVARFNNGCVRVTDMQKIVVLIGKSGSESKNLWCIVNSRLRGHRDFEKVGPGLYQWKPFSPEQALPVAA